LGANEHKSEKASCKFLDNLLLGASVGSHFFEIDFLSTSGFIQTATLELGFSGPKVSFYFSQAPPSINI
jgi:hypothetical protein